MNLSSGFIRRPVMTILVMLAILFFGILCYKIVPVSDLPQVEYPTIEVTVSYPGAEPQTMANNVTAPLEQQFLTIQGITTITSTSTTGNASIVLQFVLDRSLDGAATDVQAAITAANPQLPQNLPYAPTYAKVNPSASGILYFALTSKTMSLGDLYEYAHNVIGERISIIEGVSQVYTYGEPFAVRVQVDPQKLTAKQIGIDQLALAIQNANVNKPTGVLYGTHKEYTIDVDGQMYAAEAYNNLIIKNNNGAITRLSDVGQAVNSLQDDKYYLHFFTEQQAYPCVVLAIQKQPGTNTMQVISNIKKILPRIEKELPGSVKLWNIYDQSEYIQEAVDEVEITLLIAIGLVVLVIYVYLGKLLDTFIPACAIPMSVIGTFIVLYLSGFTVDILSLLAITLSIGFLVDDAIVVLENIVRRVEGGETPMQAAINGSKQISVTILSMTLSLVSIFIPLLFMAGILGRIFHEFAVTIISSVLISGFVSLSLTPMLCSRLVPAYNSQRKKTRIERFSSWLNQSLIRYYSRSLEWVLLHRLTILLIGALSLGLTIVLFLTLPKDFLPNDDTGFIEGYTQADDSASPFQMIKYQETLTEIILKNPYIDSIISIGGMPADNQGIFFLRLKPLSKRPEVQEIIASLYAQMQEVPGVMSFLKTMPLINLDIGTGSSKGDYQYTLQSLRTEDLYKYGPIMFQRIKALRGFSQVYSDLEVKKPQLKLHILRDRASVLNVSAESIEAALGFAYATGNLSPINEPENQYYVILETLPKFYRDPSQLAQLYVTSSEGKLVPLSQVTEAIETLGPLSVNHINGFPSVTISFSLIDMPLGTAINNLNKLAQEVLPPTVNGDVQGSASIFTSSFANLTGLLLVTFFVVYIILGILYENFFHPIAVMSTLPPAALGGLLTLYVFQETFSLYAFVGLIMLLGIVMKNGIIMIDFANDAIEKEGKNAHDAIKEACLIRFRPILMTTFAALMGAVPIALGLGGATSLSRRPLGMVIIGGLLFSQVLTLFVTPVTFLYLETLREKIAAYRKNKETPKNLKDGDEMQQKPH